MAADDLLKRKSYIFTYSSGTKLPPFTISDDDPMQGTVKVKGKTVTFTRVITGAEEEFHVPYTKYPGTYGSDYVYHLEAGGTGVYEKKGAARGSGGSMTYDCTYIDRSGEKVLARSAQEFLLKIKSYQFTYSSGTKLPPFVISDDDPMEGRVTVKGKVVKFYREVSDEEEVLHVPYTKYPGTYGSDYVYHLSPDRTGVYEKKGTEKGSGGSLTYTCTYASGMDAKEAAVVAKQLGLGLGDWFEFTAPPDPKIKGLYSYVTGDHDFVAFFGTGGNQISQQTPLKLPAYRIDPMGPPTTEEDAVKVCEGLGLQMGNEKLGLKFADDNHEMKGLHAYMRGPNIRKAFFGTGGNYLDMFTKPTDSNIWRPTLMLPKCPHGHRLETFDSGGEQACTCCGAKPGPLSKMSTCRVCEWDMCQACVDELFQLRLSFNQLDTNGDGELEFGEIQALLGAISASQDSEVALKSVFDEIDVDKSGRVLPDEFLTYMLTGKSAGKPVWEKQSTTMAENEEALAIAGKSEFADFPKPMGQYRVWSN